MLADWDKSRSAQFLLQGTHCPVFAFFTRLEGLQHLNVAIRMCTFQSLIELAVCVCGLEAEG